MIRKGKRMSETSAPKSPTGPLPGMSTEESAKMQAAFGRFEKTRRAGGHDCESILHDEEEGSISQRRWHRLPQQLIDFVTDPGAT